MFFLMPALRATGLVCRIMRLAGRPGDTEFEVLEVNIAPANPIFSEMEPSGEMP
jgi:hypothetical protein